MKSSMTFESKKRYRTLADLELQRRRWMLLLENLDARRHVILRLLAGIEVEKRRTQREIGCLDSEI